MKWFCMFIVCLLAQSCGGVEYYFTMEENQQVTSSTLYKDNDLTVSFRIYNGNISRLNLSTSAENRDLEVEILKYEHTLGAGGVVYTPSLIGDYGIGVIDFPENGWVTITSKLVLEPKPKFMTESVKIEILIDGKVIAFSKDFYIEKGSYHRFEASH